MAKKFTDNQQKAILTDNSDICVAAGAGSGKTGVLVERFVRLITASKAGLLPETQSARVEQILVITFTEKATKEMKTRIVEALTHLGLIEERRQVETAYISTIHGFCSRLLQENPFEAGVDPQFSVLEEVQARRLMRQSFQTVVGRAFANSDTEISEFVAATQAVRQYNDEGNEPLSVLANATENVIGKMRGAGKTLRMVEQHFQDGLEITAQRSLEPVWSLLTPLLCEITASIEALQALRAGLLGTARAAVEEILEREEALRPSSNILENTLAALEITYKLVSKARTRQVITPQDMEMTRLLQRIRIQCEEAKALYGYIAQREEKASLACHRLWGLALAVWKEYDAGKRRRGKLDTEDLQEEGVRLLSKSSTVRARYQKRFRHLMIDEFQDTNPLQMRLVDLLHVKVNTADKNTSNKNDTQNGTNLSHKISAISAPNHLFVVGDVQQSIYGFRHAEPQLFRNLERQYREEHAGTHVSLSVNFRSRPEILKTVETVFKQIWRDEPTPFVPLTLGADFTAKEGPSLEILASQDLSRKEYITLEAESLAGRVQQMVEAGELTITRQDDPRHGQPVAYRDIAILMRGLTDVQKYEEAFARRGIPYFVVGGGRGYYARHEIRDLLNVLTVLDTPLDDVALAATLRSPIVGADIDTLYHLSKQAKEDQKKEDQKNNSAKHNEEKLKHSRSDNEAARKFKQSENADREAGRSRHAAPLYPAIFTLLERDILPEQEKEKLQNFVNILETLRTQEDRLPVGHLLERLITQTHYDARLLCRPGGRRRLANVRKMLQMANSDPVMGVRDFIRRLRDLEKLSDREGDAPTEEEAADVVRILTIHGAKGLEFPVVILADLARSLLIPERGLFACDPTHFALGTKVDGEPNVVYKAIDSQRQKADQKEATRLLYVAMTRAREHLILCGNLGRNRGFNWADGLFSLLGVLSVPSEPEVQLLTGGIKAQMASLAYYRQLSSTTSQTPTYAAQMRQKALRDRIAEAILNDTPLDSL